MKYVVIFGASVAHGVGGARGGWADKLKASLHQDMFGEDASGEVCQVYELGIPSSTTVDVLERFEAELASRIKGSRPEDVVVVLESGTNDAKAIDTPDAFFTTPEAFTKTAQSLVQLARKHAAQVIVVGLSPVDERKTYPKISPFTSQASYFSDQRVGEFEVIWQHVANDAGATFVPLHEMAPADWADKYLFTDGLHPNDAGHTWICAQAEPAVRQALGEL